MINKDTLKNLTVIKRHVLVFWIEVWLTLYFYPLEMLLLQCLCVQENSSPIFGVILPWMDFMPDLMITSSLWKTKEGDDLHGDDRWLKMKWVIPRQIKHLTPPGLGWGWVLDLWLFKKFLVWLLVVFQRPYITLVVCIVDRDLHESSTILKLFWCPFRWLGKRSEQPLVTWLQQFYL